MTITIIKGDLENLDSIVKLFDLYRLFYKQKSNKTQAKQFLYKRLTKNECIIFLLMMDTNDLEPVGFTLLYPSFSSVHMKSLWVLNDLFVLPEFQKQGLGTMLIQKALKFAKDQNSVGVMLQTENINKSAQKLYEIIGFKQDLDFYYYFYYF